MKRKYLTGIKPTGELHLGNYIGAIKPIFNLIENEENIDIYLFIADYHALTSHIEPKDLRDNTNNLMISYMSFFMPLRDKLHKRNINIYFYKQSDIPEIFEFNWILSCYTAKGLLNRNHSYKQETTKNIEKGYDIDKGIFAGIYNYPVLMAADILLFEPDFVPVGKDQIQHIEIATEISNKINYIYKENLIKPPKYISNKEFVIPGKDGNKMSKSYNNTLPVFCDYTSLKKYIYSIKTNCKGTGEPKYPSESNISDIYKAFASEMEYEGFCSLMEDGYDWKPLKDIVIDRIYKEIKPFIDSYEYYSKRPYLVKSSFKKNAKVVSKISRKNLYYIKKAIGMEV